MNNQCGNEKSTVIDRSHVYNQTVSAMIDTAQDNLFILEREIFTTKHSSKVFRLRYELECLREEYSE